MAAHKRIHKRIKVAIVGGGCASMAAAFELTRPEHQRLYEVTIYQLGWRLGGKGASGRGVADRIEEHGLHLWMGFYENAFRLMRECYAERHANHPEMRFTHWQDAFKPAADVGVMDATSAGWAFWLAHFPPVAGEPGDPANTHHFSVTAYLQHAVMLVGELLRSAAKLEPNQQHETAADKAFLSPESLMESADRLLRLGRFATLAGIVEGWELFKVAAQQFYPTNAVLDLQWPLRLLDPLSSALRQQLEQQAANDVEVQRIWHVIDLVLACIKGSIREGLALHPQGFDAINHWDWRDWLRLHGASEAALESGFMRGIYDLAFAYEDGDVTKPRLAAGVALRGAMRMFFTYRGSLFWKMSGGMGDVVFAPLYQVLKDRGVRFEFFHRLERVELATDNRVKALHFNVQAEVISGEYQPLVRVNGVPSWLSRPDFEQLEEGADLAREGVDFEATWCKTSARALTLHADSDFDCVVLGISIGAIPTIAQELITRFRPWRDAIHHGKTVATQAFQVWMRKDVEQLGWAVPGASVSGFVEPFDTWADMSHLAPEENWSAQVRSIAYFCSVLPCVGAEPSQEQAEAANKAVSSNAIRFLEKDAAVLWPEFSRHKGGVHWKWLVMEPDDPRADVKGQHRFLSQFWTANINPTDRYVLSLPGTPQYRLSPLNTGLSNLTVAGDWTASGLDSGCVESAVMSGLLAASAISGSPRPEDIVGYDHP